MIVRPDEISARSAPSTSPLKHCDMKASQLTTLLPAASRSIVSLSRHDVSYHEERSDNAVRVKRPHVRGAHAQFCVDLARASKGLLRAEKALALVSYKGRGRSRRRRASASAARPAPLRAPPNSPLRS